MKLATVLLHISLSLDASTTTIGIKKYGLIERVAPTQNVYVIDGLALGQDLAMTKAMERLHKTNPKLALGLTYVIVGLHFTASISNLNQMGRSR